MGDGDFHVFSAAEAPMQQSFARWRQRAFGPLLRLLAAGKVTPDTLSLIGLASAALLPLGYLYHPAWLVAAYALHLACDGLDGALARHLDRSTPRGAYLDIVVDHSVLVATMLTVTYFEQVTSFWALLYTVSYLTVIVHLAAMNLAGKPLPFPVIRTKYPLFVVVLVTAFGLLPLVWLEYFVRLCAVYDAILAFVVVFTFWRRLPG